MRKMSPFPWMADGHNALYHNVLVQLKYGKTCRELSGSEQLSGGASDKVCQVSRHAIRLGLTPVQCQPALLHNPGNANICKVYSAADF